MRNEMTKNDIYYIYRIRGILYDEMRDFWNWNRYSKVYVLPAGI